MVGKPSQYAKERRKEVHRLYSKGLSADEIVNSLKTQYPELNSNLVRKDIERINKETDNYIALEYLPHYSRIFRTVETNLEDARKEAWLTLYNMPSKTIEVRNAQGNIIRTEKIEDPAVRLKNLELITNVEIALSNLANNKAVVSNINLLIKKVRRVNKEERMNEAREGMNATT